ncbi:MAG: UDP-N-acetylmuramoyl-tripeptide--D-alanyl-D-alanine ligase [Terriglobia bacterium]
MQLSTSEIAALLGSDDRPAPAIARGGSIDSRSIRPGEVFFAIRGPRFDGHNFVGQALEAGAVAAVVQKGFLPMGPEWLPALIGVPDTTRALQQLAGAVRDRWTGRVVGITGSAGKTTVKEMVAAVLERRFRVLKSAGNLNNHYGVPLTLLGLDPEIEVAVLELAMSAPGEIRFLSRMAGPQTGLITNVAAAHLEFFDSIDSIARAKRELIENLRPPPAAILNNDDERVRRFAEGFSGQVVTYGFSEGSDFRAVAQRAVSVTGSAIRGAEFEVQSPTFSACFTIPLAGRHNVENALAAIATGSLFEVAPSEIGTALASLRLPAQRMEVLKLPGEITVVNDSYNSNPRAIERMIETLASWPAGRRIVVAGEMLELGRSSPSLHRRIGRECAHAGIDWLIAVKGDAKFFIEGAREAGLAAERTAFFVDAREAGRFCRALLRPGDVILVKGSRAVRLEDAIDELRREPAAP